MKNENCIHTMKFRLKKIADHGVINPDLASYEIQYASIDNYLIWMHLDSFDAPGNKAAIISFYNIVKDHVADSESNSNVLAEYEI